MAIEDDFTIALNGDIRYTGTDTYFTVLQFHRYLQAHADNEQMAGNDLLDITSSDPSDRSTDNIITLNSPFNIDDDAAEQLYDGSITQDGGDVLYSGLVVVGSVESGTELIIIRDNKIVTSWWGTGINVDAPNNIISRMLIRSRGGDNGASNNFDGCDIDSKKIIVMAREFNDKYAEFSLTLGLGNSTAAIFTVPDLNNETAVGSFPLTTPPNNTTEGYNEINLDNGNGLRPYYSEWDKAIHSINDLYETTKYLTRRGTTEDFYTSFGAELFRGITHEWEYDNETGAMTEGEILAWGMSTVYTGTGGFTIGERVDFGTSGAVGQVIYEEITGNEIVVYLDPNSATPQTTELMTGAESAATATTGGTITGGTAAGGTGLLLADDGTDTMWVQLLSGSPPVDPLFVWGRTSDNSNQVNGAVTSRTVNAEFFGQSTGTSIIGAFGVGVEATDLLTTDSLTDLLNVAQSPPNNQEFVVSGLVSGEDRVLVAKNDGSNAMDYDQYALQITLNAVDETAVVLTGAVDGMTPQTGWLRILLDVPASVGDLGTYKIVAYTSHSFSTNTTFVIGTTDFTGANIATAANNVFVGLIDKEATAVTATFTGVYSGDVSLLGRVRDGGGTPTKPVDYPTTFNSAGGGFAAIRNEDT